jgi:hypothetical protein
LPAASETPPRSKVAADDEGTVIVVSPEAIPVCSVVSTLIDEYFLVTFYLPYFV